MLLARGETDSIRDVVTLYCEAWAVYEEAVEQLQDGKTLVRQGDGDKARIVLNPWVAIRDDAASRLESLGRALGLRPDNRISYVAPSLFELLAYA